MDPCGTAQVTGKETESWPLTHTVQVAHFGWIRFQ